MQSSDAKKFRSAIAKAGKNVPKNSGIFSGNGSQKRDPQIKASVGMQAPVKTLRKAVRVPKKQTAGGGNGLKGR